MDQQQIYNQLLQIYGASLSSNNKERQQGK